MHIRSILLTAFSALLLGCVQNDLAHYALIKAPCEQKCSRESLSYILPNPYPEHGIIDASGSFFHRSASWIIVDFDKKLLTLKTTNLEKDKTVEILSEKSIELNEADLEKIIGQANSVWKYVQPADEPRPARLDAVENIVLLDGDSVRDINLSFEEGGKKGDNLAETLNNLAYPKQHIK